MLPHELVQVIRRQPFEPFAFVLTDGARHEVRTPGMVVVGVQATYVAVPSRHAPELAERLVVVDNQHIAEVVPLPPAAPMTAG